jgi:hypothetical protein
MPDKLKFSRSTGLAGRASSADRSRGEDASRAPSGDLIPWRQRDRLPLKLAATASGLSVASLYKAAHENRLVFVRSEGRVLVETASLLSLMSSAQPWQPQSHRGAAARAKRAEAARVALR